MSSTAKTARRAVFSTMLAATLAVAPLPTTATAVAKSAPRAHSSICRNALCTKERAHVPSCYRFSQRTRIARCFIARAAKHYHQSLSQAYYIAWRESRYNWRVTNPSSGTAGLYQFARGTWNFTPYRRYSPYNPRWASLAAMWMWRHGYYSHWRVA
jgi:hypothetical protein